MKPRFKLRLDGSLMPLRDQLASAMRKVRCASDAPFDSPRPGMNVRQRLSDTAEARLRRQIARAYGSQAAFLNAAGLKPHHFHEALKQSQFAHPFRVAAQLRKKLGLPVQCIQQQDLKA